MTKYLLLTNGYPKSDDLYRNGFVHSRVLNYKDNELDVDVFVLGNEYNTYEFEGIDVIEGNEEILKKIMDKEQYEKILIHFIDVRMIKFFMNTKNKIKKIIWIHGFEALSWRRRLFNIFNENFIKYILINSKQLFFLRKFVKFDKELTEYVFVSNWMKETTEKDIRLKIEKYSIIHNPIDDKKFIYHKKDINLRKKILLIRPFSSKKYANDISVKFIQELQKKSYFNDLEIAIYGDGKDFDRILSPVKDISNVIIKNKFLTQVEISRLHQDYGIFLCPTRQDAQGVSMCEAMSSGLVPITSNNTAIPEFVIDGQTGCVANSISDMLNFFDLIMEKPEIFIEMSLKASNSIVDKSGTNVIIEKELELIKSI